MEKKNIKWSWYKIYVFRYKIGIDLIFKYTMFISGKWV